MAACTDRSRCVPTAPTCLNSTVPLLTCRVAACGSSCTLGSVASSSNMFSMSMSALVTCRGEAANKTQQQQHASGRETRVC